MVIRIVQNKNFSTAVRRCAYCLRPRAERCAVHAVELCFPHFGLHHELILHHDFAREKEGARAYPNDTFTRGNDTIYELNEAILK